MLLELLDPVGQRGEPLIELLDLALGQARADLVGDHADRDDRAQGEQPAGERPAGPAPAALVGIVQAKRHGSSDPLYSGQVFGPSLIKTGAREKSDGCGGGGRIGLVRPGHEGRRIAVLAGVAGRCRVRARRRRPAGFGSGCLEQYPNGCCSSVRGCCAAGGRRSAWSRPT